jgi:hypothetical protein
MKITIRFEETFPEHSQSVEYCHTGLDTLQDLAFIYKDAATSAGFGDVEDIGISVKNGDTIWTTITGR